MPYPTKKQRLEGHSSAVVAANDDFVASLDDLSVDVLANILGFLELDDIMCNRRLNKKVMEAVRKTIVPLTYFGVESVVEYNAMNVMTRALPNLQQIVLRSFEDEHKYSDGEDPDEGWAALDETADWTSLDIEIISNFSRLRILEIDYARLNGRYPILFNSFPLLQNLRISCCHHLKWDLEMLAGLPLLKELDCFSNSRLTGNINNLRELKGTLEIVNFSYCKLVEGNFMDLADFPHLKKLDLLYTDVTGDIRDIGNNDFSSLECLRLSTGVYGGWGYELQRISDAPDLIRSLYLLKKRRPLLAILKGWHGELSADSPDWYESEIDESFPFYIHFVKAGPRIGYQWEDKYGDDSCEVNWLDPEPDRESSDYEKYFKEMCNIDGKVKLFKGFHQPPTEEEYNRILDEHATREESGSESEESDEGYSSEEW